MYSRIKLRCGCIGVMCRFLSSAEVSTALRPFYFSVHPDLFGKYPEQRSINENSLQQLSALIEAQQSNRSVSVPPLPFYLRQKDVPEGKFKLVTIKLNGKNIRETVVKVLNACDISTSYVDKIPNIKSVSKEEFSMTDFTKSYQKYQNEFDKMSQMKKKVEEKKAINNLIEWIYENSSVAKEKYESTSPTRIQVKSLIDYLCNTHGIVKVRYESGWNISHIRGALQSLVSLATQHSKAMKNLQGRTIVLGQFTGVSLDGDVFLSIIDVRNEWLSLIKKVSQEDAALTAIPNYEKTLSSILRNIHICRRKFMPKVSATQYCSHLRQLITSIGDFHGRGKKFPSSVPELLTKYQIVVEPKHPEHKAACCTLVEDFQKMSNRDIIPQQLHSCVYSKEIFTATVIKLRNEAGPLMVSPTGQFITPASCPADELMAYIANNLDEAMLLLTEYSINKHVERALHREVKERFGLLELHKDDSITPALMISCCERLLTRIDKLNTKLRGNILYVTHYYSVLSEGVLCIPWNFN